MGIKYLHFKVIFSNKRFTELSIEPYLKGSLEYFILLLKSLHVKNCSGMSGLCNIIALVNWGVGGAGIKEEKVMNFDKFI